MRQPFPTEPDRAAFSIFAIIASRRWFALAALLVFLAGGSAYYLQTGKVLYRSEVTIYVAPGSQKLFVESVDPRAYEQFLQQQIRDVTRFEVLLDCVKDLEAKNISWKRSGESDESAADRLKRLVRVSRVPDTYQVSITATTSDPTGYRDVLNALAGMVIRHSQSEEAFGATARMTILSREREELDGRIAANVVLRNRLLEALGTGTTEKSQSNPFNELLLKTLTEAQVARQKRIEAEAQIRVLESGSEEARAARLRSLAEREAATDISISGLKTGLAQRRSALESQLGGLSAQHPLRQKGEEELARLNREIEDATKALTAQVGSRIMDSLHADAARNANIEDALRQHISPQMQLATQSARKLEQIAAVAADTDRLRSQLAATDDRLHQMQVEQGSPARLRIYSPARTPSGPELEDRYRFLFMIIAASLLGSAGLTIAVDACSRRVASVRDMEQVLGFPLLAAIPERRPETNRLADDQMLRLSLAIERSARKNGLKIVVVCSVSPQGGTTMIIQHIRQDLGRIGLKTLTINMHGSSCISDKPARVDTAFNDDVCSLASIRDHSLAEPSETLRDVLTRLSSKYDVILVDALPPTLCAETEYLVSSADTVLLVAEASRVSRQELALTVNALARLGVEGFGAVLNRVRAKHAGPQVNRAWEIFNAHNKPAEPSQPLSLFNNVKSGA